LYLSVSFFRGGLCLGEGGGRGAHVLCLIDEWRPWEGGSVLPLYVGEGKVQGDFPSECQGA
jgi:hypothetical protein